MKNVIAFIISVALVVCSVFAFPDVVSSGVAESEFIVVSCFYYNDMMIDKETGVIFDTSTFNQSALVSGGLYRVLTDTSYTDIYDFDLWSDYFREYPNYNTDLSYIKICKAADNNKFEYINNTDIELYSIYDNILIPDKFQSTPSRRGRQRAKQNHLKKQCQILCYIQSFGH